MWEGVRHGGRTPSVSIRSGQRTATPQEVRLIDQTPRYGAGNARIAFVHPKATGGVLLELTQRM